MDTQALLIVLVAAGVTVLLRFLPFFVFGGGKETPELISYLGRVLPFAIMGMLVVFCLKNVSMVAAPYGTPEAIACLVTVAIHLWRKNTLLSIVTGTVCYMMLVQMVF